MAMTGLANAASADEEGTDMEARKFYELTTDERLGRLTAEGVLAHEDARLLADSVALPTSIASNMIENQIGSFPVPLGVAQYFVIDGTPTFVPMAVEEPSVIAAAGNAAKRCRRTGGFHTSVARRGLIGQIVFLGRLVDAGRFLEEHRAQIAQVARQAHPSLEAHGGGLRDVQVVAYPGAGCETYTEFRLTVDPGEAMGANVVNTLCEAVAHYLEPLLPGLRLLMAILSNDAPGQVAKVNASFAFEDLETETMSGEEVARRIDQASRFAEVSPERAATQNKGVMNGIDAVILATGNDTRNVAAAAYSGLSGSRRTWTSWHVDDGVLNGAIEIALPIGAVGGAISALPVAKLAMRMLGGPDAARLMGIAASVGLASNMAALRALVTRGIQKGHMNLQLRSLAVMAGARGEDEIAHVADLLRADQTHADFKQAVSFVSQVRASGGGNTPDRQ